MKLHKNIINNVIDSTYTTVASEELQRQVEQEIRANAAAMASATGDIHVNADELTRQYAHTQP